MKKSLFTEAMLVSVCVVALCAASPAFAASGPAPDATYADSAPSQDGVKFDAGVPVKDCPKSDRLYQKRHYVGCKLSRESAASDEESEASEDTDRVVLAEWVRPCKAKDKIDCDIPRSARPSTVAGDSPVISHRRFIRDYPNVGETGYQRIRADNKSLCNEAQEYMVGLNDLDQLFKVSGDEYNVLTDIYNSLPAQVRLTTRVMQVTQAVESGALCVLSAGLYCIAAVANGVGNIVTAETSKDLQLANIRLSIANIAVTKLNIWSNRLTLRLDGIWLKYFVPACHKLGYDTISGLPPMPALPKVPDSFGKPDDGWHW